MYSCQMAGDSVGAQKQLKYTAACCPLYAVRFSLKTERQASLGLSTKSLSCDAMHGLYYEGPIQRP